MQQANAGIRAVLKKRHLFHVRYNAYNLYSFLENDLMKIKFKKNGNLILEIDKYILDLIGIDEQTGMNIIIVGYNITITPRDKELAAKKRETAFEKTAKKIIDKYESVLKKLAKT